MTEAIFTIFTREHFPSDPFTSLELQNPSHDVCELRSVRKQNVTSNLKLFCGLVLNDRILALIGHTVLNLAAQMKPKKGNWFSLSEVMSEKALFPCAHLM